MIARIPSATLSRSQIGKSAEGPLVAAVGTEAGGD